MVWGDQELSRTLRSWSGSKPREVKWPLSTCWNQCRPWEPPALWGLLGIIVTSGFYPMAMLAFGQGVLYFSFFWPESWRTLSKRKLVYEKGMYVATKKVPIAYPVSIACCAVVFRVLHYQLGSGMCLHRPSPGSHWQDFLLWSCTCMYYTYRVYGDVRFPPRSSKFVSNRPLLRHMELVSYWQKWHIIIPFKLLIPRSIYNLLSMSGNNLCSDNCKLMPRLVQLALWLLSTSIVTFFMRHQRFYWGFLVRRSSFHWRSLCWCALVIATHQPCRRLRSLDWKWTAFQPQSALHSSSFCMYHLLLVHTMPERINPEHALVLCPSDLHGLGVRWLLFVACIWTDIV